MPRAGHRTGRSFYAAPVSEFRVTDDDAIIGRLSSRHVAFHAAAEAEQVRAWAREIEILKETFAKLGSLCDDWQLLLEVPLLRLTAGAAALKAAVILIVLHYAGADPLAERINRSGSDCRSIGSIPALSLSIMTAVMSRPSGRKHWPTMRP